MALRTSADTGSLCLPSPRAMNELRNAWPAMVPRTLTRPRVPKNSADSGQTTYVQPPLFGLFCSVAVNCLSNMGSSSRLVPSVGPWDGGELIGRSVGRLTQAITFPGVSTTRGLNVAPLRESAGGDRRLEVTYAGAPRPGAQAWWRLLNTARAQRRH